MNILKNDVYVLGTGLSHDGSTCLLKNGEICVAIEKERLTRKKHDGGNDGLTIDYCLRRAGITIDDVALVVQTSTSGEFLDGNSFFLGPRPIPEDGSLPVANISHHLAHAYYAIGTCPFEETAVLVLDGAGSHFSDCMDIGEGTVVEEEIGKQLEHLFLEKDSFYLYKDRKVKAIYKDFSPVGHIEDRYPMISGFVLHSIGQFYEMSARYCFRNLDDSGKLMGLAPYGRPNVYDKPIFELRDGRVFVAYGEWLKDFMKPVGEKRPLNKDFQYYADIAFWVQKETERAVEYLMESRRKLVDCGNLCYTGGVALNAVANGILQRRKIFDNLYLPPAAGDSGISVGCAYYGWMEILRQKQVPHKGNACYGRSYSNDEIERELSGFGKPCKANFRIFADLFFKVLPLFVRQDAIADTMCSIQFCISGAGTYFVVFDRGMVSSDRSGENKNPDCSVFSDSRTFFSAMAGQHLIMQAVNDNKIHVHGEMSWFIRCVDLHGLYDRVRELCNGEPGFEAIRFERVQNVTAAAAQLLADGKVIAWFQGGCEFGPRALGNRSILADPRLKGVKQHINGKIKFREDFRPFAPAILLEQVSGYFHFEGESPYMIMTAKVKEEWKDTIPDVVHLDDTSRIQTVTEESNERFYRLIREFKELTGMPIVLNTSFNMRGMPIIETPLEALTFFFDCALDFLIMEDVIVFKDASMRFILDTSLYEEQESLFKA